MSRAYVIRKSKPFLFLLVIKLSALTLIFHHFCIDFDDILVIIIMKKFNRMSLAIAFQKGFFL